MKNIKTFEGFKDIFKSSEEKSREKVFSTKDLSLPVSSYEWIRHEKDELNKMGFKYRIGFNKSDIGCFEKDGVYVVKKSPDSYEVIVGNNSKKVSTLSDINLNQK